MTLEQRLETAAVALKEHGTTASDALIADLLMEAQRRIVYQGNTIMGLTADLGEQSA